MLVYYRKARVPSDSLSVPPPACGGQHSGSSLLVLSGLASCFHLCSQLL